MANIRLATDAPIRHLFVLGYPPIPGMVGIMMPA